MTLSVENLLALDAADVPGFVRTTFEEQLKLAPSVHNTFFASASGSWVGVLDASWTNQIAAALMCSGISRSSLYGFSGAVNQNSADAWWRSQLSGANGLTASQALYRWAFPSHCHDNQGTTFQAYLNADPGGWAVRLADLLTSPAFVNVEISKLIASDPNWLSKLNVAYAKLRFLDPTQVQEKRVVAAWTAVHSSAVEQWPSYNYLDQMFSAEAWIGVANQAIGVGKDGGYCSTGGLGVPICSYWTEYGLSVIDFLGGVPSNLGLTTGRRPNNQVDRSGGGGGCFVAGSPLQLHDGSTIGIHEVAAGHRLLARDGVHAVHTDELVVVQPHAQIPIYGFNDDEPFFTAGHLFWTPSGWKAFEPEISRYENPTRPVDRLEIGDVIYRLRDADDGTGSATYDEVTIERFTGRLLEEDQLVHGVHLDGASTYHVHGYLVGMNYPMITAQRLMDGFATLNPAERAQVAVAFESIMPLLRKAIGRFVEEPIRRALRQ